MFPSLTRVTPNIIQVVSAGPPLVNGVTDFARVIASELRAAWGIDSQFLVCNTSWQGHGASADGFQYVPMRKREGSELCTALDKLAGGRPASVLVQLSPYGFHPSGIPFWLLEGLRRWKRASLEGSRLIVYFHELYAMSPPWRKAFWLSPLQRACSKEMVKLSDVALTSVEQYVHRLEKWDRSKKGLISRIPVVSSVGEPPIVSDIAQRPRRLAIWGSPVAKQHIFEKHFSVLKDAIEAMGIEQIVDIGLSYRDTPARIAGVPVEQLGVLPLQAIGEQLLNAVMGGLWTNPNFLGKSSLFAAFSAHGVPVLCLPACPVEARQWDGIRHDVHYVTSLSDSDAGFETMRHVAKNARDWYLDHRVAQHARIIVQSVRGPAAPQP